MALPLRVLIVEDSEDDAQLVLRELQRGGFDPEFRRVDTHAAMDAALGDATWDVIAADWQMPRFSGLSALTILKEREIDIPFIIVSGKIGEDTAVAAMKAGAHDYILKDNLARLVPAIQRELREVIIRQERRLADAALRKAREELEKRVEERTRELAEANQHLQREIVERQRVMDKLQRINEQLTITTIRERELAEEAQRQAAELDATFSSMADGITIHDPTGKIVRMNPAAEEILGYPPANLARPVREQIAALQVQAPDGRPLPLEDLPAARALRGEVVRNLEVALQRAGEGMTWLSWSAAPIRSPDGRILGAVSTVDNITDLHELQELREEYVALISHDLRNQLTSLMGHAQLLFRTLAKKGLATEAASAESILVSSTRMNSMIQELVESAHLESGQPELNREPVDLFEMVSDIAGRVGTAEDAARIRLERQNHVPLVAVDIERFERVITNLLTNALKYSSPDAAVLARISSDDGRAIVSVQDQGIGIPTQDLPYLFQRFFRAKTGKKADGLGLGLYITRLLVEAHQGHVWVESEVGKGSTFYVALPFFQNSS